MVELGETRGRVWKLVGCVVVTEEEQNKLLMGVGLAGGSHIKLQTISLQQRVQYCTVVEVHRGYMFKVFGIGDFVHLRAVRQVSLSLSLTVSLYLELYNFYATFSYFTLVLPIFLTPF